MRIMASSGQLPVRVYAPYSIWPGFVPLIPVIRVTHPPRTNSVDGGGTLLLPNSRHTTTLEPKSETIDNESTKHLGKHGDF